MAEQLSLLDPPADEPTPKERGLRLLAEIRALHFPRTDKDRSTVKDMR